MVTKVFELYIGRHRPVPGAGPGGGLRRRASLTSKRDRPLLPGGSDTHTCLILDRSSGKLLGAQLVGGPTVGGRVDVYATAITAGMTVAQVNDLDLVYAPPVAPVYDPILIAASQAVKLVVKK